MRVLFGQSRGHATEVREEIAAARAHGGGHDRRGDEIPGSDPEIDRSVSDRGHVRGTGTADHDVQGLESVTVTETGNETETAREKGDVGEVRAAKGEGALPNAPDRETGRADDRETDINPKSRRSRKNLATNRATSLAKGPATSPLRNPATTSASLSLRNSLNGQIDPISLGRPMQIVLVT